MVAKYASQKDQLLPKFCQKLQGLQGGIQITKPGAAEVPVEGFGAAGSSWVPGCHILPPFVGSETPGASISVGSVWRLCCDP